jgi:excisionase family DNA binding protein
MLQVEVEDLKALPDFLTIQQFAQLHGVTSRTIERWLSERRIDSLKVCGSIRIPKVEYVRLMSTGYRTRSL